MDMSAVLVAGMVVNQDEERWNDAVDDKTGIELDGELVAAAEKEEIDFMKKIGVGKVSTLAECLKNTGRKPISTKFVRVNKGTEVDPDIRCRLCARDFKEKGGDAGEWFAAMPPLEGKKLLFGYAAKGKARWKNGRWQRKKLLFIDVKKAHLNGKVKDDEYAYVQLPDGTIWRLKRWLYGMRPAAQAWEAEFTEKLESVGFKKGSSAPTAFHDSGTDSQCVVHGDDFTFLANEEDVKEIIQHMKRWYEIKVRGILGGERGDDEEITILNRKLSWRNGVIEYEADEKHAQEIIRQMGLADDSRGLEAPAEKMDVTECTEESEKMDIAEAKAYRGLAARGNYLGQDRMDIQFATKESCRSMAVPRINDWQKMKRLARYLLQYPRLLLRFLVEDSAGDNFLDLFADSDWAGDRKSRKSTSGGVAMFAGGAVKSWASTQSTVAMSVGEAEYYVLVKAAAEALGIQALAADLGITLKIRIWVDSRTAKAIVARMGLGKVRHMEVKYLWAQEAHRDGRFEVLKIDGEKNPADVLTKPLSAMEANEKLKSVGMTLVGRLRGRQAPRKSWADINDDEDCEDEY